MTRDLQAWPDDGPWLAARQVLVSVAEVMMARRKTYRKKSTAKAAVRKRGGAIYKVKGGYRVRRG